MKRKSKTRGLRKRKISIKARVFIGVGTLLFFFLAAFAIYMRFSPIRIGVLLKLTGPEALPFEQVLEWARENSGKNIEFVYVDANTDDIKKAAKPLLDDHSIRIVIGPESSDQAMALAPLFIEKKKLLISPTATSADLYRAFAGQDYFWRTVESDVAQVRVIMQVLSQKKVEKVALIYANTSYGKTFFDWTGFYATEKGIEVTSIQALNPNPDYQKLVSSALKDNPDYIICVASPIDTVEIKKQLDKSTSRTKLFVTDLSEKKYVLESLGTQAEGLEVSRPAADPESGFDQAYRQKFQTIPPAFMATTYDAFMLAAATLARQEYIHKYVFIPLPFIENTATSLKKILYQKNDAQIYRWDQLEEMFEVISKGHLPNLAGASGPIVYDLEKGVDPTNTYYSYSVVKDGAFVKAQTFPSAGGNVSAAGTKASLDFAILREGSIRTEVIDRKGFQAVIIATSDGWENYRHQSDALAVYRRLKENGVSDDNIHLFLSDDVAYDPRNNPKNSLYHVKTGSNNRQGAEVDFSGSDVTVDKLKDVLLNLNSNENTDMLLYIVDHGGSFGAENDSGGQSGGDYLYSEGMIPFATGDIMTSSDLKNWISQMRLQKKFRQMLIVVESCYGAAMGKTIDTPGVLFMSGASDQEVSYGANYSEKINAWLADNFTYQFLEELSRNPDASIDEFYQNVYLNVPGSHVTLLNYQNFGALTQTSIGSFFKP